MTFAKELLIDMESEAVQIHRMAWWCQLLNAALGFLNLLGLLGEAMASILGLLLLGIVAIVGALGCAGILLVAYVLGIWEAPSSLGGVTVAVVVGFLAAVGIVGVAVIGLSLLTGALFARRGVPVIVEAAGGTGGSYLKVSPGGLEYRLWPFFGLSCGWEDVCDLRVQRFLGLESSLLCVENARVSGMLRWSAGSRHSISLAGFKGWPDGALADDMRKHAPHVFGADTLTSVREGV